MRKAENILLILILLTAWPVICFTESTDSTFKKTEKEISEEIFVSERAVLSDGSYFVPLEEICRIFDLREEVNGSEASVKNDKYNITLTNLSKTVWLNDKVFSLGKPVTIYGNEFYVPLRSFSELLGAEIKYQEPGKPVRVILPDENTNKVVINFAGDTVLACSFENIVKENYSYPFANLACFKDSDLSMLNLENPITARGIKVPKKFNFRMCPDYVKILQDGGVDIVNLANNHTGDYGAQGIEDTLRYLDDAGIKHVGAGPDRADARKPVVIECKGIKFGFLGYYNNPDFTAGTNPFNERILKEDICNLKKIADYVIVNFHWGEENAGRPKPYQITLAHLAVDSGADLIVGHHPHVLQGIEKYNNGIIAYSLGNFIFGGNNRTKYDTVLLQLNIQDGKILPCLIPVCVENWQPNLLNHEEGEQIINTVEDRSKVFSNPFI
ncbi:MAG: CapA family protein [Eubacteriales bacterium]|jgi:poly-gamma-glutamate synthesis protein (capsule biosynthesis protein)